MKNNYLLESTDSLSLQKKIEEIIHKNHFEESLVDTYDMEEVSLDSVLEDLDTYGLFSLQKVIIMKNVEAVSFEEEKQKTEHFLHYLKDPNPDYLLIITTKKLDERKKITKEIKKLTEYVKVQFSAKDYAKEALSLYQIENKALLLLLDYCKEDITKLQNECDKLKMYCLDTKTITEDDIKKLVVKKLNDATEVTFSFVRALAEKNKKLALELYYELLSYQIEPLSIIGLLASQIRIIYQVKLLQKKHLSNDEMARILKEKSSYRIVKTKEFIYSYQEEELLQMMIQLADVDLKIKSSDVEANFLIELFILNI